MKIDPFQCIAVCISMKHFTSFLLLKGLAVSKAADKCHKKKNSSQLTGQQNIALAHALSDSFLWSCSTVLNFISSLPVNLNFATCVGLLLSRVVIRFLIGGPSRFCSVPDWRDFNMNQLTFDHVNS